MLPSINSPGSLNEEKKNQKAEKKSTALDPKVLWSL